MEETSTQKQVITKTQLYKKFIVAKDLVTEEWLESIENTMTLFDLQTKKESYMSPTYSSQMLETREIVKILEITWTKFKKRFKVEYKDVDIAYIRAQEFIALF